MYGAHMYNICTYEAHVYYTHVCVCVCVCITHSVHVNVPCTWLLFVSTRDGCDALIDISRHIKALSLQETGAMP